jgi:hypothetical protein
MAIQLTELHINDPKKRFPMHDTKDKLTTNASAPVSDHQNDSVQTSNL